MNGFTLEEKQFPLSDKTGQIELTVHAATTTSISPGTLIVANYSSDRNRISKVISNDTFGIEIAFFFIL